MMSSHKNHYRTLILLKLILLSFLFAFPQVPTLEWQKVESTKYSQLEVHADIVVLKGHSETKLIKRLPFFDDAVILSKIDLAFTPYSIADTFFDFKIPQISYALNSALARAPPA